MKYTMHRQVNGPLHEVKRHVTQSTGKPDDNQNLEEEAAARMMAGDSQDRLEQFMKVFSKL